MSASSETVVDSIILQISAVWECESIASLAHFLQVSTFIYLCGWDSDSLS